MRNVNEQRYKFSNGLDYSILVSSQGEMEEHYLAGRALAPSANRSQGVAIEECSDDDHSLPYFSSDDDAGMQDLCVTYRTSSPMETLNPATSPTLNDTPTDERAVSSRSSPGMDFDYDQSSSPLPSFPTEELLNSARILPNASQQGR